MRDEFKNCDNCLRLEFYQNPDKYLCNKMHFCSVEKQKFFYNPKNNDDKNKFFLNKYIALTNAIPCKDYDPIQFMTIQNIELQEPKERGLYGDVVVNVMLGLSDINKTYVYKGLSRNSKIRNYFAKMKAYIEAERECPHQLI